MLVGSNWLLHKGNSWREVNYWIPSETVTVSTPLVVSEGTHLRLH